MIKLINSYYDKNDGVSYSRIRTEIGDFEDWAFLHQEDAEVASSFLGCEIAEYRATIKYFEKKLEILNYRTRALEDLKRDFKNVYKDNYHECEILEKRLNQNYAQRKEYKGNIASLKKVIYDMVGARTAILEKLCILRSEEKVEKEDE